MAGKTAAKGTVDGALFADALADGIETLAVSKGDTGQVTVQDLRNVIQAARDAATA